MRRFVVLVTVVVLMTAMLAASAQSAQGLASTAGTVKTVRTPSGVPVEATACETVAGVAGFEWRAGGEVCWLNLPGWDGS
jgi:phosphate-selective porin